MLLPAGACASYTALLLVMLQSWQAVLCMYGLCSELQACEAKVCNAYKSV